MCAYQKNKGGLGIRSIKLTNKALIAKQVWRIFEEEKEWNAIVKKKYLSNFENLESFLDSDITINGSQIWNNINKSKSIARLGCK